MGHILTFVLDNNADPEQQQQQQQQQQQEPETGGGGSEKLFKAILTSIISIEEKKSQWSKQKGSIEKRG